MEDRQTNLIEKKLNNILLKLENIKIAEYIELVNNTRRLLFLNFISGIARGLGAAFGFVVLGAVMIWLLGRMAVWNIPIVGDYIAEIVRIVMEQL